ncbi:MAG: DNA-3-methyladenine glycosylase 2 family protein [Bdellovibrionales bacterium]|nr:DNA-3-methyladenine glycosylase 2 family protein [Bdellovibrionales bacterium]
MKLVASILSQQLSIIVAKVMLKRFLALFGGKEPSAAQILAIPVETIKAIGISQNKANYIHNVAQFVFDHKLTDKKLDKMPDEDIIDTLIQIKGVGRWTVEMLLIFGLAREDVFALDDLGVQKGVQKMYKLEHLKGKELKAKMLEVSQRWSPYRSYACLYLWNFQGWE